MKTAKGVKVLRCRHDRFDEYQKHPRTKQFKKEAETTVDPVF